MQILVVEDDVQLAGLVSSALIEAGHDPIFVDGEFITLRLPQISAFGSA